MKKGMLPRRLGISNPGKHLIPPSEAIKREPDFFNNRPEDVNWTLRIRHLDGRIEKLPWSTDWRAESKFGFVTSAVVTDSKGLPVFDRPRYDEAPNVNIVAFGRDKKGELIVAMISQPRPHADNVFDPENKEPMVFEQIPMGFLAKVIGEDQIKKFESVPEGAKRETTEETGATAIKDIFYPEFPQHYPNPTFVGTTSNLVFVEVDLEKIEEMKMDRNEPIFKAEYISLPQFMEDLSKGQTERGYARMGISNSAMLIFLSGLSAFQNAERNEKHLSAERRADIIFKQEDPKGYVEHRLRVSKALHPDPESYKRNKKTAEEYLKKL